MNKIFALALVTLATVTTSKCSKNNKEHKLFEEFDSYFDENEWTYDKVLFELKIKNFDENKYLKFEIEDVYNFKNSNYYFNNGDEIISTYSFEYNKVLSKFDLNKINIFWVGKLEFNCDYGLYELKSYDDFNLYYAKGRAAIFYDNYYINKDNELYSLFDCTIIESKLDNKIDLKKFKNDIISNFGHDWTSNYKKAEYEDIFNIDFNLKNAPLNFLNCNFLTFSYFYPSIRNSYTSKYFSFLIKYENDEEVIYNFDVYLGQDYEIKMMNSFMEEFMTHFDYMDQLFIVHTKMENGAECVLTPYYFYKVSDNKIILDPYLTKLNFNPTFNDLIYDGMSLEEAKQVFLDLTK